MRLAILDHGHKPLQKIKHKLIKGAIGHVPGPIAITEYRADFFGQPFNTCLEIAMRKTTVWHKAEVELFAAFVSRINTCRY